jgi:hypothetical protein
LTIYVFFTSIEKLFLGSTMTNSKVYDLTPIKKHQWFTIDLNHLRFSSEIDEITVFEMAKVGSEESNMFGITTDLIVTSCDKIDLEVKNPKLFESMKLLLIDYVRKNC